MAGERGRDWWSVVIGIAIVTVASAALWAWLDGSTSEGLVGGLGPFWLLAICVAAILLLILVTRLSSSRR